jgi:hypothetical protein
LTIRLSATCSTTAGSARSSAAWSAGTTGSTGSTGAALAHLFELLLLLSVQDFREPAIDVLLKFIQLLFLIGGEPQLFLKSSRQNLSRLRWRTAKSAGTAALATTAAGTTRLITGSASSSIAGSAGTTSAGTWSTARPAWGFTRRLSRQRSQFFFRDDSVLVGIGAVEQPQHALIGDLFPRKFAIRVLVERQHASHDRIGASARAGLISGGGTWRGITLFVFGLGLLRKADRRHESDCGQQNQQPRNGTHERLLERVCVKGNVQQR